MAVPADLIQRGAPAEAEHVGGAVVILSGAPSVVGVGDAGNVFLGQLTMRPVHHPAELPRINEQDLAVSLTAARQKPQTGGNLGRIKKLARQRHHAIDQIGLDQVLPDLTLA